MTTQWTTSDQTVAWTFERADGALVVRLVGELDASVAAGLLRSVVDEIGDASLLVIDSTELSFCDSAGLRSLVEIARHQSARGDGFLLASPPSRSLARLIAVTGTGERLRDVPCAARGMADSCG